MHEAVAFLLTFAEFFLPLKLLVIYQANIFPIFNEKLEKSLTFANSKFLNSLLNWLLINNDFSAVEQIEFTLA